MAKSSTRRVNIYINGKEVEASVKQIRAEMNKLVNEQNRMVIGSDEYIAHAKRIRELREVLKEHSQNIGSAASAWTEAYNKLLQFGTGIGGMMQIFQTLDSVTDTFKQVATDLAAMDDIYSDVIKTTGLTREQVEELNDSFKQMDTRTPREQLNNLAYIAGKLGISSKEMVQQFVEPAEFAKVAGMEVSKFKELIETDMNGALKKVLAGFSGAGGFDKLLPVFQDLGLDSARAAAAISSMANSLDKVESAQQTANQAMLEGVSCYEEFSVKNNNMQAALEKARKKFQDTRLELGEKLYPILLKFTKTSTLAVKSVADATTWASKNKVAVVALIAPLTLYLSKLALLKSWTLIVNGYEKVSIALKSMHRTVTLAAAAAQAKLAGNTTRAAAAQKMLNAAAASTPWTAIATAIAAVAVAAFKLATRTTAAKSAIKDFREQWAEQKVETDRLFDSLRQLKKGSEEYNKVQKKIIETYPDLLKDQLDEQGNIKNIEIAYNNVVKAQKRKIALAIQEEKITEVMKKQVKDLSFAMGKLSPTIGNKTVELAEGGMDANAIIRGLNRYILKGRKINSKEEFWIRNIVATVQDQQKEVIKIKQSLAPWVGDQVEAIVDEIEQEVDEETHGGSVSDGGSITSEAKQKLQKKKTEWENILKEIHQLFNKDEVLGLDKVDADKQKIRQQYGELISRIEAFVATKGQTAKDLADKVRTYMDNTIADIDKAARTEKIKKVQEQYKQLCEQAQTIQDKLAVSTSNSYAQELATIQSQWQSMIKEIDSNIKYYQSKLSENYDYNTGKSLSPEEIALLNKLLEQKKQAVATEAEQELNVVKRAEAEITDALLSENDRRIADIRKQYETRISVARTAIETLRKLDAEGNKERINQLEQQIALLQQKMNDEIGEVQRKESDSGIGKLMQIDWKHFKKDWRQNLAEIADVIQDFADTANSIFSSISEIQSNHEEEQLNLYNKTYDERKEKLEWQLEQGIISQEYYDAQLEQMDKEKEQKEKEIEIAQFNREKKAAVAEAIISGIVAAVKSFENGGGFPYGLITMALSLAATGAQVAAIQSQPEPYAKGGYIDKETRIIAGEAGSEWIASHSLLSNPETAPVIDALQRYQQGDHSALQKLEMAVPDSVTLSQAATQISGNFAADKPQKPTINNYTVQPAADNATMERMLEQLTALSGYLRDPQNRQAVISRELQVEFENQENFLRKAASLS